jgi:hypothetical protein
MRDMKLCELTLPENCRHEYIVAGAVISLAANSEGIHAAMGDSFVRLAEPALNPDVTMQLLVTTTSRNAAAWPKPYFRGLDHIVFAGFDSESEVLIDLRRQRIIGRFSHLMAADEVYLRRAVFPAIFGIISEPIRITPVHCACLDWNGRGLLLAGDSGAGKSTLALALAQSGLAFISDDWTYLSRRGEKLCAWSLSNSLKLLPDAVAHFPQLAPVMPAVSLNGELAYELEPHHLFGIRCSPCAEPHCVMFLERRKNQSLGLSKMSSEEAALRLERNLEQLPAAIAGVRDFLVKTIRILVQLPCWELRYGDETPQAMAQGVLQFLSSNTDLRFPQCEQLFVSLRDAPKLERNLRSRRYLNSSPLPLAGESCERSEPAGVGLPGGSGVGRARAPGEDSEPTASKQSTLPTTRSPDLLRRFTPTPFRADLIVMERIVRLETNSLALLNEFKRRFGGHSGSAAGSATFTWKIVGERYSGGEFRWSEITAFSQEGLSYARIGQGGFLAVDSREQEAVAFLPEELAKNRLGFDRLFLTLLLSLTSWAMRFHANPAASAPGPEGNSTAELKRRTTRGQKTPR